MKILVILFVIGAGLFITRILVACDSDSARSAVLDILYPRLNGVPDYLDVWLSRSYDPNEWNPRFDRWQKEIDGIRLWSKSVKDPCVRSAYGKWLDYYQNELNSARKELKYKDTKTEQDNYEKSLREEKRKSEEFKSQYKLPEPPR